MEGEREILLRANVPETGGGEDLAEIFAGIETPSFSSSFSLFNVGLIPLEFKFRSAWNEVDLILPSDFILSGSF